MEGEYFLMATIKLDNTDSLSQMEISEVGDIFMTDKKGYITLNVIFKKEGKIMLRSSSGIQKWFSLIKVQHNCLSCVTLGSRHLSSVCFQSLAGSHVGAHRQLGTKDFWSGKQQPQGPGGGGGHINNVDSWLLDRQFFGKNTKACLYTHTIT